MSKDKDNVINTNIDHTYPEAKSSTDDKNFRIKKLTSCQDTYKDYEPFFKVAHEFYKFSLMLGILGLNTLLLSIIKSIKSKRVKVRNR